METDLETFVAFDQAEQVCRLEILGRDALRAFGVVPERIVPLAHAENTTFRVESSEGTFCLRIARPDYQTDAAIASEIVFLAALREAGLPVPEPYVPWAVKASAPEVPEVRNCVLLRWQAGEFAKSVLSGGQARALGATMARLHDFAVQWSPPAHFQRRHLHERVFGPLRAEEGSPMLEEGDRALLTQVAQDSRRVLEGLKRTGETFGLIHGDLHQSNVLFEGDAIRLIDFDDLGWAFWIADFAAALAYQVGRPTYDAVHEGLREGYRSVRPLPPGFDELLPTFLRLRFLTIVEWVLGRADNPHLRETGPAWIRKMCGDIRAVA